MVGSSLDTPPGSDEIEVSVFGPGYGESIVLHVGENRWLLVDSCVEPVSKTVVPLDYLRLIGVDPATAVQLVVATHWHDDHVRGLTSVINECRFAELVFSSALRADEFLALVKVLGRHPLTVATSGVREFYHIIKGLEDRAVVEGTRASTLRFAIADRLLWSGHSTDAKAELVCKVYALSPSDDSVYLAQKHFAALFLEEGAPKGHVLDQSPNHVAVALWVRIDNVSILLGADLENTSRPGTGWSVIVNSGTRPKGRASIFKIPHHGSQNADDPRVWTEMLEPEPIAVLTPFAKAGVSLPTTADIARITFRTDKAYATARSGRRTSRKRAPAVERAIRETVGRLREVDHAMGHARFRTRPTDNSKSWSVELFGEAFQLR